MAAVAVAAASPRSRTVEPRLSGTKAAMIERPVRVEEGTGQHVVAGRLGRRVAEFGPWWLPRTSRRRESWLWLSASVEELEEVLVREKSRTSAPSAASAAIDSTLPYGPHQP